MRLFSLLVALCLVSIVWIACSSPPPDPTPDLPATITTQVKEQLASIPTATPLPTYTLSPTFTPYPTFTPVPTHLPLPTLALLPTYTPYPTATPYPTLRPLATATPRPTATPTRTPTIAPIWHESGHWYRHSEYEVGILVFLEDTFPGIKHDVRMATLDADPSRDGDDLDLTLGCIDSTPVGYLSPYSQHVSANVDVYRVGILDESKGVWLDQAVEGSVILTDEVNAVYITNRASMRGIVRLLKMSSSGLPAGQYLTAIVYESNADGGVDYWAEFDAAGAADALRYLGCH